MRRYCRGFAAWIACFAVLLASLAPTVSHVLAGSGLTSFSGVQYRIPVAQMAHVPDAEESLCHGAEQDHEAHAHAQEAAVSEPGTDPSHSHGEGGMHFEHCPFCFTHAGSFGLSPSAGMVLPVAIGMAARPLLFYQAPQPLLIWSSAQPRGPPLFSSSSQPT